MLSLVRTLFVTAALQQGADDVKRRLRQALIQALIAVVGGLLAVGGGVFLLVAAHDALAARIDPLSAKLICGAALLTLAVLTLAIRQTIGRDRPTSRQRARHISSNAGIGLRRDMENMISRNAGTLATGAFVAGLLLAARPR